jgi:hypothetical protein
MAELVAVPSNDRQGGGAKLIAVAGKIMKNRAACPPAGTLREFLVSRCGG